MNGDNLDAWFDWLQERRAFRAMTGDS